MLGGSAARYRNVFVRARATDTARVQFERQFRTDAAALARSTAGIETAVRRAIPFFGVGLLAEIPFEEIRSRADPNDDNHDGVSGRVNFERGFVGRFGRKAQMASLQGFVRLALVDHLNVTTNPVNRTDFPEAPELPLEIASHDNDAVSDPELGAQELSDLLAFVALMAAPEPDAPNEQSRAGRRVFTECGCTSCHVPALRGPRGLIPAYSDLLLHDMGPELADGVTVGQATGSEFRTQPLWGIATTGPYLHDGRADSLEEANAAHGGEADSSRKKYLQRHDEERRVLLHFLRSLGGGDHRPSGLLPMDAPLPPVGAPGGPLVELTPAERERFLRGRNLFDQDFSKHSGLGPLFNGDSCRSCHFDPVIGGAGPRDVDVVRQGVVAPDESIGPPSSANPIAHRHSIMQSRPAVSSEATFFERRQTPTILGLGLIDAISDATIRMHADPDDRDGDGIRGRVHVRADGRIGRFGWKADIATLADFTVRALSDELGITDSEIGSADLEALTFFMSQLAPPPRRPIDAAIEARGAQVFTNLGCAKCHVPTLPTQTGTMVTLYS
ncbi:MAG: di-heme oxidoredictase family protein, partial [Thermomicrobiales bacterium]